MKCIVTYYSAQQNLAVLLTLLQAQLIQPEEIIIIDTSPNKTGLEVAQKFNSNSGIPIKVECARVGIYEAWNRGIDLAGKDANVVIMNDDIIVPLNFIDVLGLIALNSNAYCIVPNTPAKDHYKDRVDVEFGFYARLPETSDDIDIVDWMPGFCFYLSKECIKEVGLFDDKHYKCWFGDDDYQHRIKKIANKTNHIPILKINSMFVYHFGGKSYQYQSKEVQKLINKDRKNYAKKYKKLVSPEI
jgi:GT2 family glycosyltransferase